MPPGATAGGGTSLACGFAALPGHRAEFGMSEPTAPSGNAPVAHPMGIPFSTVPQGLEGAAGTHQVASQGLALQWEPGTVQDMSF